MMKDKNGNTSEYFYQPVGKITDEAKFTEPGPGKKDVNKSFREDYVPEFGEGVNRNIMKSPAFNSKLYTIIVVIVSAAITLGLMHMLID